MSFGRRVPAYYAGFRMHAGPTQHAALCGQRNTGLPGSIGPRLDVLLGTQNRYKALDQTGSIHWDKFIN